MKKILLITICLLAAFAAFAQSNTDKVRQFERLMREWKSAGYSTGSEKYAQLKSMVSEGCKMRERVAKSYIEQYNASSDDIRVNSWLQYIKEKRISISMRDLREKTDDDGRRIVYCWIKYSESGKQDREDFVGFKFDGGKILYICNDDMERANRLKSDSENNVVENKSAAPFTITSCTVSNVDYDNNVLPFDAAHTQYLKPEIRYTCKTSGSYDIYVKFYDANGSLRTGSDSPSGYSQVNTGKSLSSGSGSVKLSGWGGKDSGHWRAGNYRYEFYYNGNLLYTHRFSVPEGSQSGGSVVDTKTSAPFTITSCRVINTDKTGKNQLPFDADHTQYLNPEISYTCNTAGSYDIYVKFYNANGNLSTGSSSPSGYTQVNSGKSLSSGSHTIKLRGWGGEDSGHWRAGSYRYEFYYNGNLLYTHRFSVPEGTQSGGSVVDTKTSAPFTITSCTVINTDKTGDNKLPFDAAHTQYLNPEIRYTCKTAGSYDIYVKFYDANGSLSTGSSSPSGYTQVNSGVSLSSGSGNKKLKGWGKSTSGNWRAGNYRYEFYYNGNLLYTHRFSVPEGNN